MDDLKKFGRNSRKLFKRLVKREDSHDNCDDLQEKVTFTTRIRNETRYITWNIENFSTSPLNFGEYLQSPEFTTGFQFCTKWRLRVYPRGKKSKEKIGLYLYKESSSDKANVQFEMKVGNLRDAEENMVLVLEKKNILMTSEEGECGTDVVWSDLSNSDLKECIKECMERSEVQFSLYDKSMKIFCILNVSYFDTLDYDESSCLGSSGSTTDYTLSNDLKAIFTERKFCDMRFQIGKNQIPAHKAILAARSQYIAAMFEHPMEESQTNVVNIEDVEFPVFNDFLCYIYTGKVENFTVDNAIALYSVADKYVLDKLRKLCRKIILSNVCVDNVCKVAVLADQHSDPQLKSAANHVFRKFKHQIFEKKEWKKLIDERQHLVSEILRDVSSDLRSKC